jgi:hypothetical protein
MEALAMPVKKVAQKARCHNCHFLERGKLSPIVGHCRQYDLKPLVFYFETCPSFYPRSASMARPGDLAVVGGLDLEGAGR